MTHSFAMPLANVPVISCSRLAHGAWAAPGRSRMTKSTPLGTVPSIPAQTLFRRRRIRFLCTAFPIDFDTMKPKRDCEEDPGDRT